MPFILSATLAIAGGCTPSDPIADLLNDSPFTKPPRTQIVETEILQFRSFPIQCPAHLKLSDLPSWPKQTASEKPSSSAPLSSGFSPTRIRLWSQNGIQVAVLPPDQFQPLYSALLQNGCTALRETTYFVRNNHEIAYFPVNWLDSPTTLFISESESKLRGVSLTQGDLLFRLNGQPLTLAGNQKRIHVNIVPTFQSAAQRQIFIRDQQGRPRTITESTVIVFEKLLLSGMVNDGAVILIAPTPEKTLGSLGELFLKNTDQTGTSQLVLMIVPKIIKAKRTKQIDRNEPRP